jgi:hypothetical protein
MLNHPDLMLTLANDRHRALIAEADRKRLATSSGGAETPAVPGHHER